MFGFGLKDKSKKVLEEIFELYGPTPSWLSSIVKQGKPQDYNEYDVAIWYMINEWEFQINQNSDNLWIEQMNKQIEAVNKISKFAHKDTGFESRISSIKNRLNNL
tara:strand:- start:843 stop:1157 length:315 start_codon:yes stop_codon:yes gene_type:complete